MFRTVVNCTTGEKTEIPVDDAWILANRPSQVIVSLPQANYALSDTPMLSVQLKTPPLTNGQQNNLSENIAISLQIGDVVVSVNLVNGAWSDSLQFVLAGNYLIKCLSHVGNELVIGVS